MRQHLGQIAHVDVGSADRAITEMIEFGLGNAISVFAGIARDHTSSRRPLKNGCPRYPFWQYTVGCVRLGWNQPTPNESESKCCVTDANFP